MIRPLEDVIPERPFNIVFKWSPFGFLRAHLRSLKASGLSLSLMITFFSLAVPVEMKLLDSYPNALVIPRAKETQLSIETLRSRILDHPYCQAALFFSPERGRLPLGAFCFRFDDPRLNILCLGDVPTSLGLAWLRYSLPKTERFILCFNQPLEAIEPQVLTELGRLLVPIKSHLLCLITGGDIGVEWLRFDGLSFIPSSRAAADFLHVTVRAYPEINVEGNRTQVAIHYM